LKAEHYRDDIASDLRIDALRAKMEVTEEPRYSREYHDPDKRSIANAIQIFFRDGSRSERVEVEYPIGHRRRRAEGIPLLIEKFRENASTRLTGHRVDDLIDQFGNPAAFDALPVTDFMALFHP
ncbi:MAG: 2-methylcitrate dehydratase, partial [Gammaproteobacteria bacterium]|nr:2-methylcitrate dehydratase [Gammaproteobacteria bacterium]